MWDLRSWCLAQPTNVEFILVSLYSVLRVDAKLLEKVEEYDAVPSEAASYGKNAFWDERYAADEEVRAPFDKQRWLGILVH